ncbi:C-terminal binding protein [Halocalculus aciditolerans]|uniref:Phosphoglycerate dehydrogenase family protein n=1 Tax=Halocalculus aciditolerans TaxID=1383812 RepID=A0A830FJE4_9EURY|nr:C-terminal binding protein [Halocalculus aciditolerans]GGL58544.1 phosphoglycerate dehydrogenase family protein [Halocalculus aciditolerans]
MLRVVVADDPKVEVDAFSRALADREVELSTAALDTEAAVRAAGRDADVLVTNSETPVTAAALRAIDADIVAQPSIGVDNVALAAAETAGVTVVHAPDYCVDEVATHTLSLLLACVRRLREYDASVRDGEWSWETREPIHRFAGSTVGLVSFGPIARAFRERLRGFDVDVVAYDPYVERDAMRDHDVEKVTRAALAERADHVTVHAPLTDETRGLVDADFLDGPRDGAVLVNTGRGPVVDEAALVDALDSGALAAAGLDVFEDEPPTGSPLLDREDVVLSPHSAWYSVEAMADASASVAADVRRVLDGDPESATGVVTDEAWLSSTHD